MFFLLQSIWAVILFKRLFPTYLTLIAQWVFLDIPFCNGYITIINCSQSPFINIIFNCISLSPTKHRNMRTLAKLRSSKAFPNISHLQKSKFTYPNEWTELFYMSCCIVTRHGVSSHYQWDHLKVFVICSPESLLYYICKQHFKFVPSKQKMTC